MTEYASSNETVIKYWDVNKKQIVDLDDESRKKMETRDMGWKSPLGLTFEMPKKDRIIVDVFNQELANNVILTIEWSNDAVDKLAVGKDILEKEGDKYVVPTTKFLPTGGFHNIVSITAYEKAESKEEEERSYVWFNFPPPAKPQRDLRIN